jgi:hypothetical protein
MTFYEKRPWGWMVKLIDVGFFWLKFIRVLERTSLQYHWWRSELHIGTGGIRYVPAWETHRLTRGWYVEFAWGECEEFDISRIEDDYGRDHGRED